MAKINFIFFCNNAEISPGTRNLNALSIFDTINANNFPAIHRLMFIVVNFDIDKGKHKEQFKVSIEGTPVLTSEEFDFYVSGDKHQFVHKIENLKIPGPGKYDVEIFIDGKKEGSSYFVVLGKAETHYA